MMRLSMLGVVVYGIVVAGCFGDSEPSGDAELSSEECARIGGRIVEGIGCAQEIPEDEMRALCENSGMRYEAEFNAGIE